jgi:hypothetical protein
MGAQHAARGKRHPLLALSHYWSVRSGDTLTIPFVGEGIGSARCNGTCG